MPKTKENISLLIEWVKVVIELQFSSEFPGRQGKKRKTIGFTIVLTERRKHASPSKETKYEH